MKEEGDWSSERRRALGSTKFGVPSIIPDWASLPPELVEGIAGRVLSTTTGGVDAYMDMRAVCSTWHSAVAKPSPLAAVADLRFRPRHWLMVDLKYENNDDHTRLFLHVPTGRFRRLRLLVLRDHLILGASDGLILLRDREHPHLTGARVLNPFTGDMLHFAAPLWKHLGSADVLCTAVSGGPQSTLLVWRNWEWRWDTVIYADPTSHEFAQEKAGTAFMTSMVTFQGSIFLAGMEGSVLKFVRPAEHRDHELVVIAQMSPDVDIHLEGDDSALSFLVESAGELLLVRHFDQTLKVFRVDIEHRLLEEVKSIGSCRALFLGNERCVAVDVDKLPSVNGDCIYMFNWLKTYGYRGRVLRTYNLRDCTTKILSNDPMLCASNHPKQSFHEDPWDYSCSADNHHLRPPSLIQVLLDYCNDATRF
ncbi:unnamed protein product [Alopecurus aequalis]